MRDAVLAEFDSPERLVQAVRAVRLAGYRELDAYTPYPVEAIQEALAFGRSRIPLICCALGLIGAASAYGLQWLLQGHLYPINVGGRPLNPPLSYLVITFEMGVLAAAITAFCAVFYLSGLVRLWDPVDQIDGFTSASDDRFWLVIGGRKAVGKRPHIERELADYGPLRVVALRAGRVQP